MKFTKMQGAGNDYVYVNNFQEEVMNPSELAVQISDRHFGVGSDGLILICPSKIADFQMVMYNADGSRGEMCGNGIRCVGKYVYDYGLTEKTRITVETLAGVKELNLTVSGGKVSSVTVDMGSPVLEAKEIPICPDETMDQVIDVPITVGDAIFRITGVSMGNPHAVVFVDDVDSLDLPAIGPAFEHHPWFPDRINTEFVQVLDPKTLKMRVWERGSGETLACGTGACASVVAAVLNGKSEEDTTVKLLGGDLKIRWDRTENKIWMSGPAEVVFDGEWKQPTS